jgi:hypothetical protein
VTDSRACSAAAYVWQALANAQKEILFTKLLILAAPLPAEDLARDRRCFESYEEPEDR